MDRKPNGVRARGNSILIDFTYKGERCRETLSINPTKENLRFAKRKKEAISYALAVGNFDYLEHFPNSKKAIKIAGNLGSVKTIEQALKEWLKRAEIRCAISTIRDYNSAVYYHLIPVFGDYKLNELKASMVNDWIASIPALSAKRINNVLTPLRQTFSDAYCDEVIDSNPMDRVKNLPKRTREPNPFKTSEITKILATLEGQAKNLIQFAFWTGLRTSELIGLNWEDYDANKKKVFIRRAVVRNQEKITKTTAGERTIDLNQQAIEAIESQRKYTEQFEKRVFHDPRNNKPVLDDQKIRKVIWKPALKAANIPYREPYQTRHTFASMMLTQGKSPMLVSRQMGHSNPSQTFRSYARWIDSDD